VRNRFPTQLNHLTLLASVPHVPRYLISSFFLSSTPQNCGVPFCMTVDPPPEDVMGHCRGGTDLSLQYNPLFESITVPALLGRRNRRRAFEDDVLEFFSDFSWRSVDRARCRGQEIGRVIMEFCFFFWRFRTSEIPVVEQFVRGVFSSRRAWRTATSSHGWPFIGSHIPVDLKASGLRVDRSGDGNKGGARGGSPCPRS